ncbi:MULTISPECIES: NUDIX domain-containing protein [Micromonospora]|uniref:NUDIX domain-containing protein n=1 Tax=Micromonospora TaxID=1873 RepID=UPI001198C19F|nr:MULTISPECIES: NUDIX domain-containing protein [unclassified Micromonospora]QDY06192.1 NUDIX domain-containing protein [Micromonospora sp. HM134]
MSISWADSYVGQLRALAGDRTLMFVGARAVVRDDDGRVLLIRRSDNGQWALPAGAMELGESIADCAVREVREETGLRALRVSAFALYTGPDRTHTNMYGHTYQIFTTAFRVDEWDGELARVTDETTDAAFLHPHEFPAPLSLSVPETLADLDVFTQTNRLILK